MQNIENLTLLTWNIRGINNLIARKNLRKLVQKFSPWVLLLQETKCEQLTVSMMESIWDDSHEWIFSPARGQSGGLAISWDKRKLKLIDSNGSHSFLWARWELEVGVGSTKVFVNCINVYGPQSSTTKRILWEELGSFITNFEHEPLCLAGDFNCIKNITESRNCMYRTRDSHFFLQFLNDFKIWDLSIQNQKFTWFSSSGKSSRLDRIILNSKWFNNIDWRVLGLSRKSSDHTPLFLQYQSIDWGPKSTKIFDAWYKDANCKALLHQNLTELKGSGLSIHDKLKKVGHEVQKWNSDQNNKHHKNINVLEETLNEADQSGDFQTAHSIQVKLKACYEEQEEILRQKSRLLWLQKGDANSRFFHMTIKKARWRNNIQGIQSQGLWITSPDRVKNIFADHFEDRFRRHNLPQCYGISNCRTKSISEELSKALEFKFEEAEIYGALLDIHPNKAPGPDGFIGFFIRKLWDDLKEDIILLFNKFWCSNILPPGVNSSFLTLIPKVHSPMVVQEFRPISLINCTMKILLKLLANRLKQVISSIISEVQFAFIKERNISECILIAGEIVHSIQNNLIEGVILKVDFEKAFDTMRWDFLDSCLRAQGFGHKWCNWMWESSPR